MVSEPWWSSGYEFESHYLYLFYKNLAQDDMNLCKFQDQMTFTWGGMLENNINNILGPHLTV
jgi:hypothetical protein